jgi:hypothetical protein
MMDERRTVVAEGYDAIGDAYVAWSSCGLGVVRWAGVPPSQPGASLRPFPRQVEALSR